jgi:hypothetical protein
MTATERPSDAAMAQAVREQQDRGYYTGACDCIIARAREIDALRMNTHAADCHLWGVKHHECAVREIERLRTLDAAPAYPVVSAECWRRAIEEFTHKLMPAWIEQRARELAREGK